MKSLTLILISLLFLSSCTLKWESNTENTLQKEIAISETKNPEAKINKSRKDFWSGIVLNQTDNESSLTYNGKVIKIWSHNPPEKVPFVWDEACSIVLKWFEKLPLNSEWRQWVWDTLTEKEKKECIKESFNKKITINQINAQFSEIREMQYERYNSWLYDTKTGNLQTLPINWNIQVSETNSGIIIFIRNNYDWNDIRTTYTSDFSKLLLKEEISKQ